MKYCIGCIHLDLMPGYEGQGGGTYTGPGSHFAPELLCGMHHWQRDIADDTENQIVDIEREMRRAETCPDYAERDTTQTAGNFKE